MGTDKCNQLISGHQAIHNHDWYVSSINQWHYVNDCTLFLMNEPFLETEISQQIHTF